MNRASRNSIADHLRVRRFTSRRRNASRLLDTGDPSRVVLDEQTRERTREPCEPLLWDGDQA